MSVPCAPGLVTVAKAVLFVSFFLFNGRREISRQFWYA